MARVVIVGAGLYGLIAAKTYLQVAGVYDKPTKEEDSRNPKDDMSNEIPECFTSLIDEGDKTLRCRLLVMDAASDIGGTWAEERLYPNLLSQNSYGLYEFSDMSLVDTIPEDERDAEQQFIPGWRINRYLHAWVAKWKLKKHIRLGWRADSIRRLESKKWQLKIGITADPGREVSIICDKLILATGLTSVPNVPNIKSVKPNESAAPIIHAKDIGAWSRTHLGYRPFPSERASDMKETPQEEHFHSHGPNLRSVAIYGGAKSSFDLVHLFATIHENDPTLRLSSTPDYPVQVHWIIRDKGSGPAWMVPPSSSLPTGEIVASDKVASTRFLHHLSPCSYEKPIRLSREADRLQIEGSWLARLFHGNPVGRWLTRCFWNSVDRSLEEFAQYETDSKLRQLRPEKSVISCGSSIGIANQRDLWDVIKLPHVQVHRSTVTEIASSTTSDAQETKVKANICLQDGEIVGDVDLVIHATGYKPIVPISFEPPSSRLVLGLSGLIDVASCESEGDEGHITPDTVAVPMSSTAREEIKSWGNLDQQSEREVRQTLAATGCTVIYQEKASWADGHEIMPYRLFRRMVAPKLVAEGDRSFAILGVVLTSTIAVVAEVQALWVTAFLTGGLDKISHQHGLQEGNHLNLGMVSQDAMNRAISEDVVLGSLTGTGLEVDAIHYNDSLMRDLGLNPHRLGGGLVRELTGVYEPSVYAGVVEEWRSKRACLSNST